MHKTASGRFDQEVWTEIYTLVTEPIDQVIVVDYPTLEMVLFKIKSPSTRLMSIRNLEGKRNGEFIHGRASRVLIIQSEGQNPTGKFIDYSEEEWERYYVKDWLFIKTKSHDNITHSSNSQ